MDNGCNGNVIYIPLDYTPPVPKKPRATISKIPKAAVPAMDASDIPM